MKPEPSAERRSKKSHVAVLAAAEALLAASGYSSITIDQIASRAGVSKATIYRWWPNKAAIFMEVYGLLGAKTQQFVETGSLAEDLRKQVRTAFKLYRETVAGVALAGFVAEGQSNPETARLLRETFAKQRRQLNMAIIQRGVDRGEVAPGVNKEVVADLITGAVYYAVLMGQSAFTDARADEIVRTVLHGICAEPPKGQWRKVSASTTQGDARPTLRLQP